MKEKKEKSEEAVREAGIYRVTLVGSVVNLLLLVFKFVAGILGHSAAMLADAVHSLSDFVTDIIVLYQYTVLKGRRLNSQAVVANAWHHRSDALSSIGTAVGIGGAILLGEQWLVLDPLAAVVVSLFIMKVAIQLLVPCVEELLEKSLLPAEVEEKIKQEILAFPGVTSPHHLRTRRIGSSYAIEVHIRMDGQITLEEAHHTATAIENRLKSEFGSRTYINIHVEPVK